MADLSPEDNLTMEEIEEMTNQLALELKKSIQKLQDTFDRYDNDHSTDHHHHHHQSAVSELKKDQELHKREFDDVEVLRFKALEKLKLNTSTLILLKKDMERLKSQEDDLNQKLNALESKLIKNKQEMHTDRISITLSRKLELFMFYYIAEAPTSNVSGWQLQEKFNWLRQRRDVKRFEEETASVSRELRVRNKLELESKILELVMERKRDMKKARTEGKKVSYTQWINGARKGEFNENRRKRLIWIQSTVTEILRLVCSQMIELMFFLVASKDWDHLSKFRYLKHIFRLLVLLQHQGETMFLGKITSVIENVDEEQLQVGGQYRSLRILEGRVERVDDDDGNHGDDNVTEFDRILDLFLREVLCLDSILTYPMFSQVYDYTEELVIGSGLNQCMEKVKEIVSNINGFSL